VGYSRIKYEDMKRVAESVFQRLGYSAEDSADIADVILEADLRAIESHGVQRLILYYTQTKSGLIRKDVRPEIIKETPVSALIDGNAGSGQISSQFAMRIAIKKAKENGMAIVTVKNSNHNGIEGYYASMAQKEGLLGMVMTNTEAIMVPTFGKRAMLGTNPIAVSISADPYPFLLDMATTVIPRGKLEVYLKKDAPVPLGWITDETGNVSQDAKTVNVNIKNKVCSGILPLGGVGEIFSGHKGYGLGLMVEILTGIIGGGYTSNHCYGVTTLDAPPKNEVKTSHTFIVIDYSMFGDKEEIENHLSVYLQELRDSDKADGQDRIYTHGEKEAEIRKDRLQNGILSNEKTVGEIKGICEDLGIELPQIKVQY
jgi:L-2-hydroxycarboxylate dehydrogenase (NAD+)